MRNSIASTIWRFSTTRMLHEYVERLYLPAAGAPDAAAAARPIHRSDRRTPPPPRAPRTAAVAPRISLALAIHNHQPVGNFGWVFAEVYDRAYLPMLEALERHPGVRLSLHYTGPLLEWLAAERPEFLARLGALVARGQVELLGGGLYEPILASLPEHDRVDQLTPHGRRRSRASRAAGRRAPGSPSASGSRTCPRRWPRPATAGPSSTTSTSAPPPSPRRTSGAPTRPRTRATCSRSSGPSRASATGSRSGRVEDVIDYLRDHATEDGDRVGHDGRRRREVRRLAHHVRALLGRRALGRAVLRGARGQRGLAVHRDAVAVAGRASRRSAGSTCPRRSYAEMGEWALPPDETVVFTRLLHDAVARHEPRGPLAARRVLAQLPGQVPRDQRPPQADAAGVGEGGGHAGGPGADRGAGPPPPRPVQRLLLARAVRRHLHLAHAPRHATST